MKTKILTSLMVPALALTVAFGVWSPVMTSAQIKGAQLLLPQPKAEASAAATGMACPKCKTEVARKVDTTARGANKPVVAVAKHQCASCDSSVKITGTGKQAVNVAAHSCGMPTTGCCK